ncbi:MAG: hypothetical protein JWM47_4465, partial [Acidimicrobiales bacterium]|nr:hypothetical protein [Acidimicrobiales bacterium]
EEDDAQAAEADGAAAGAADQPLDAAERMGGGCGGQGEEKVFPETGMGEATEVAGDGGGLAVFLGELAPGAVGGGDAEDGIEVCAAVARAAARGVVPEVGEDGLPFGIGERGVGDAEGEGHSDIIG